ncbi:MAG: hypothetical protein JSR82_11700 [Verrucomicrobia bacterium]|nr:hypothetical protein [Verrucomicrobiota bacterium]
MREDIFEHPTALIVHGSTKTVLCLSILDTTYCAFIAELNSPLPTSSVPPRLQEACSSSTLQLRACRKAEAQAAMDFIKQADDATFVALLIGNPAELRPAAESRGWTREELAKLLLLATAGHDSRHPVLQNAKPHLRAVD